MSDATAHAASLPLWAQYIQVIGPPLLAAAIAAFGAAIAWQQKKIAHTKLRHDLYDRRYKLFDVSRNHIIQILVQSGASMVELKEFLLGTADAIFLFDAGVVQYLKEIEQRSSQITVINETLPHMPPGVAQTDLVAKKQDALAWMNKQPDILVAKFRPFLGLDQRDHH